MSNVHYNPVDDDAPPSPNPPRRQFYDGPSPAASSADLTRYQLVDGYAAPPSPAPGFVQPGPVTRPYPAPFQGAAVGDGIRASFASSQLSVGPAPSYQTADYDSVHGLRFNAGSRPDSMASGAVGGPGYGTPLLPQDPYRDDPEHDIGAGAIPLSPVPSGSGSGGSRGQGYREFPEKRDLYASPREKTRGGLRKAFWCSIVILVLLAGVAVPVFFYVIKPKFLDKSSSSSSSDSHGGGGGGGSSGGGSSGSSSNDGGTQTAIVTGGTGSTVTTDNGTTFTYTNTFGGKPRTDWFYLNTADRPQRILVLGPIGSVQQWCQGTILHASAE